MTFLSPYLLLGLLLVPAVLAFLVLLNRRRARYPVAYTNLDLLATLVEHQRAWRRWVPVALVLLALVTATTALARPRVHQRVPEENATIVLLVDVSGSMRAADVRPSRLEAAVTAMQTFLDEMPKKVNVGLVTFSSSPDVLTRPTTDHASVHDTLNYLTPDAATALSGGLETATRLVVRSLAAKGVRHEGNTYLPAAIVLESDGAQNRGTLTPAKAAREAKAAGIRVYGVALGTPHGTIMDDFGLTQTTIPVPPDPGDRTDDRADHGREGLHGAERRPARRGLQDARLEHRPEGRGPRDHVVVRGRDRPPPRRRRRPRARLVGPPALTGRSAAHDRSAGPAEGATSSPAPSAGTATAARSPAGTTSRRPPPTACRRSPPCSWRGSPAASASRRRRSRSSRSPRPPLSPATS